MKSLLIVWSCFWRRPFMSIGRLSSKDFVRRRWWFKLDFCANEVYFRTLRNSHFDGRCTSERCDRRLDRYFPSEVDPSDLIASERHNEMTEFRNSGRLKCVVCGGDSAHQRKKFHFLNIIVGRRRWFSPSRMINIIVITDQVMCFDRLI